MKQDANLDEVVDATDGSEAQSWWSRVALVVDHIRENIPGLSPR